MFVQERCPPGIEDFLYICDDAYERQEFLVMERKILQGLNFDINIPVPYTFLRRYAKVGEFHAFIMSCFYFNEHYLQYWL